MRNTSEEPPAGATPAGTAAGIADFAAGLLRYQPRIVNIWAAADADANHVLVNVYAGYLCLLMEEPAAPTRARHYLQRAQRAEDSQTTASDRLGVRFLSTWIDDDLPAALDLAQQIIERDPTDLVTLKLHQYINFNLGRPTELLRIALAVEAHNTESASFLGMAAFAYEQCHLLADAEATAQKALALDPDEPWAQHARAHVLLTTGRIDEGAAALERSSQTWVHLNSFMRTHLWWHLCLFKLSQGQDQEVLRLYDSQVWGVDKAYSQDQIGAVSLLARLEISGVDVGGRWAELANHLAARQSDTTLPFLSLQYLYGLGRADRQEALVLLEAIRQRARTPSAASGGLWDDIVMPAAEGLLAHARRADPKITLSRLGQALPGLLAIGGSHAQRDFFEQVWLDALIRDQRWAVAQHLLEQRRAADPDNVPTNRSLATIYRKLNLPAQSLEAQQRAVRRLVPAKTPGT